MKQQGFNKFESRRPKIESKRLPNGSECMRRAAPSKARSAEGGRCVRGVSPLPLGGVWGDTPMKILKNAMHVNGAICGTLGNNVITSKFKPGLIIITNNLIKAFNKGKAKGLGLVILII